MNDVLKDIAARAAWTFAQAFLAVFVVADLSTVRGAALAGTAAVVSLIKGVVATKVQA